MFKLIKKVFSLLNNKDKKAFYKILALSIFISFVEMIGVSLIMPFIQISMDFSQIHQHNYYEKIYSFFHIKNELNFVLYFGLFLISFYLFRSLANLFYYYKMSVFSKRSYLTLTNRLFSKFIGFSYRNFVEKNSSELIKTITTEAQYVSQILSAFILLFGEIVIVLVIYALLLFVNWKLTLMITTFLILSAYTMSKSVTKMIKKVGIEREEAHRDFYKILGTTFGNFKMIKLQSKEPIIEDKFSSVGNTLFRAYIKSDTLSHVPRLFLEAMSFILVIIMILYWVITMQTDISSKIGILSLFLLALYRLMPSINRILTNYNQIIFLQSSLDQLITNLTYEKELIGDEDISFNKRILLKNITFGYNKGQIILKDINLEIKKGEKIAFVGASGSGKSTLVDLIVGLYKPYSGEIFIDDEKLCEKNIRSWRQKIGYIPQDVYLFDATVAENVAFTSNKDEIDFERVKRVLNQANIWSFLKEHQDGVDTKVGDGGVKLSGGQKQRIAIARALYHDPDILVLDEATSALDEKTEKAIMREVYKVGKDKTLIIIAHRLSTLEGCNLVYEIKDYMLSLKGKDDK